MIWKSRSKSGGIRVLQGEHMAAPSSEHFTLCDGSSSIIFAMSSSNGMVLNSSHCQIAHKGDIKHARTRHVSYAQLRIVIATSN